MDKTVKNLYDGLNLTTLPKSIKDYFFSLGYQVDKDNRMKPYMGRHNYSETDFYILEKDYYSFLNFIERGLIFDKDDNEVTKENLYLFLKEYGKGFYKGYSEFEATIKPNSVLFELDTKEKIHKIFSRIHSFKFGGNNKGHLPMSIHTNKTEYQKNCLPEHFYYITNETMFKAGFNGGEYYKSWEIILHNPTIFDKLFKRKILKKETLEAKENKPITETPELSLKNIPTFNLQQRFYIFQKLKLDSSIHKIETEKQSSKHKILALILGISPDNAKHLINNTYKDLTPEQKTEVDEYLLLQKVKL
jgi:hypothetical protein